MTFSYFSAALLAALIIGFAAGWITPHPVRGQPRDRRGRFIKED